MPGAAARSPWTLAPRNEFKDLARDRVKDHDAQKLDACRRCWSSSWASSYLSFGRGEHGRSAGPLVTELTLDKITGVTVQDATTRCSWPGGRPMGGCRQSTTIPALAANVTRLISDVLTVDTSRLVANTPASHGRLKVSPNDYVRRVELRPGGRPAHGALHRRLAQRRRHPCATRRAGCRLSHAGCAQHRCPHRPGGLDRHGLRAHQPRYSESRSTVQNGRGSTTLRQAEGGGWTLAGWRPVRREGRPGKPACQPAGHRELDQTAGQEPPNPNMVLTSPRRPLPSLWRRLLA